MTKEKIWREDRWGNFSKSYMRDLITGAVYKPYDSNYFKGALGKRLVGDKFDDADKAKKAVDRYYRKIIQEERSKLTFV